MTTIGETLVVIIMAMIIEMIHMIGVILAMIMIDAIPVTMTTMTVIGDMIIGTILIALRMYMIMISLQQNGIDLVDLDILTRLVKL